MWSQRSTCYFCNKKLRWKDITLADGCQVPACGDCYSMVVKGRKIAEERGLYDPNKIRGGESMTKVERKSEGAGFLNREFVEENGITALKIESEGENVTFENKNKKTGEMKSVHKWQVQASFDGQKENDPNVWTMNNTSFNSCIDLFGDDTKNWIGKSVEITIGGEGEMRHIKIDMLRTKKNLN